MANPIEEFLSGFPGSIRAIVEELRKIARNTMSQAHEFLYYDAINYSVNDSPKGRICYIEPTQTHVTLGFLFGGQLNDKSHLFRGGGKRARHITLTTVKETKNDALKELVKEAWSHGATITQ